MDTRHFQLELEQAEAFRFDVRFDQAGSPVLQVDEAPPLGGGAGPNPARLLGAAIGHCLASSLLFCLQKARVEAHGLAVSVTGTIVRNETGRFRVASVAVRLQPGIAEADRERIGRCLEIFQDFCIVTESVRNGLDVRVEVEPRSPA